MANDLLGSMITTHTHVTAQHLSSTFHDFQERRFDATHGGSLSQKLEDLFAAVEESTGTSTCAFSLDMFATAASRGSD